MDPRSDNDLAIVLFGKTGNGKSSVGNIILSSGKPQGRFNVGSGLASTTDQIKYIRTETKDKVIEVIDIPDFTNLEGGGDQIKSDIRSLKNRLTKDRYAVLLAVRCDVRYTQEEYDIYTEFKKLWGEDICRHLIVAFTFGDRQDRDLDQELKKVNPELKSLLRDAGKRRVVFDDRGDKEGQIKELMQTIQKLPNENKVITNQPRSVTTTANQNQNSDQQEDCCTCFKNF